MLTRLIKTNSIRLLLAYTLTIGGFFAAQIYPLVTGFAINGVLNSDYSAILWLCGCHFIMVVLEVCAKTVDTRVFTKMHAEFATSAVSDAHRQGLRPSLVAGRASLLREYITFLERDVPAALLSLIGLAVSLVTLFWLDPFVGGACFLLLIPAIGVYGRLAVKSKILNSKLNNRLESEVGLLQVPSTVRIRRHFRVAGLWRVRLSDLEARSYGMVEIFVIALFGVALWRVAEQEGVQAGTIYAIFAYIWRFVTSLDQVPQVVQQIAKLADINERFEITK